MEYDETLLHKEFIPLINEYDEIFKSMEKQIGTYRVEHETLQKEIKKLINENKFLSQKLEKALQIKENFVINEDDKYSNEIVHNLRTQLTVISQEKDTTFDLWQNSLKIIDHLETELTIYKGNKQGYVSKNELEKEKQKYALEIKELQKTLKSTISQQEQKSKNIFKNLELRGNEFQLALEGQRTALNQIEEKTSEIAELKERLNYLLETCNKLKEEIDKRDEIVRKLSIIDQDSKAKVLEAIILTEAAMSEKESAIKRETEAKDEIREISNTISEIIKEADEKIKTEKEIIKKQYNENITKLLEDMKSIQRKLNEKELQLEKVTRENKMFEEEISRQRKGNIVVDDNNTSKLMILEKNLDSSFQKLLMSERRLLQMTSERDRIRIDLDQMAETFERDRITIEINKQKLERKIKTLQNELSISNRYVEEYVIQIKDLNSRMIEMEKNMTDKFCMKEKMFEKMLTEKINNIRSKNTAIQNEMESHLKSEHSLNKRWKKETNEILDKLQNKIKELKTRNSDLQLKLSNSRLCTSV